MQRRSFVAATALVLAVPTLSRAAVCDPDPDQFSNGDTPAGDVLCGGGGARTQTRRQRRRARRRTRLAAARGA